MDLRWIRKLVRLMDSAELLEMEVEEEGKRVRLRKKEISKPQVSVGAAPMIAQAHPAVIPPTAEPPARGVVQADGTVEFLSPMVGTFYRSSSPGADPFVSKGAKVSLDTVLCIIEAMKVMNEIKAECEGEIVEILAKNGDPVEFNQPLFLLRKA